MSLRPSSPSSVIGRRLRVVTLGGRGSLEEGRGDVELEMSSGF